MTDKAETDDGGRSELNRVWWHSRRGLRELDLLLLPFVEDIYPDLSDKEQAAYVRLLDNEDPELLAWFTLRALPLDPEFSVLIERIRAHDRPVT